MLSVITLCFVLISVKAHQSLPQNDADLQSELMPQELNPEFVSAQDPIKVLFPMTRDRRSTEPLASSTISSQLKQYSRMVSCAVLALSAVIEIVLFLIEHYNI